VLADALYNSNMILLNVRGDSVLPAGYSLLRRDVPFDRVKFCMKSYMPLGHSTYSRQFSKLQSCQAHPYLWLQHASHGPLHQHVPAVSNTRQVQWHQH